MRTTTFVSLRSSERTNVIGQRIEYTNVIGQRIEYTNVIGRDPARRLQQRQRRLDAIKDGKPDALSERAARYLKEAGLPTDAAEMVLAVEEEARSDFLSLCVVCGAYYIEAHSILDVKTRFIYLFIFTGGKRDIKK